MIDYRNPPTSKEEVRRRYQEAFPGWESLDARGCPRGLLGEWCQENQKDCDCMPFKRKGPLDHYGFWRTPDGEIILTAEPYPLDGEIFAQFVRYCTRLGLTVRVEGYSPYNPSNTILVVVRRREGTGRSGKGSANPESR